MPEPARRDTRAYDDAFAENYEAHRGQRVQGGYHDLLDQLEADFVERYGKGGRVVEVGCGTGLVLQRIKRFARSASGVDISPNMLALARARDLDVQLASATALPFDDNSFDVACSFKVLAHIEDIRGALSEMARVVKPGGHVIAEFYNPWSLRALAKRWGPAGRVATGVTESEVFTRYDSPADVSRLVPPGCTLVDSRGVRVAIPAAAVMRVPGLRSVFRFAEHQLCDSPHSRFGGFWIAALRKA
jgi:ubiquinone/menaquinone biosynthesis C-methylase UbiE